MMQDASGLILPRRFVDEKTSLKKVIDDWITKATSDLSYIKENYFLTFHAKFNPQNPREFVMKPPKVTFKLPNFMSNTMVFFVCNARGLVELLWMVPPVKKGAKLQVEFNKEGVAYLQSKQAMPS